MEWILLIFTFDHLSVYSTYHMVSTCGGSKCSTTPSSPWTPKNIFWACYKLAWNPCKPYFKYIWCACWSLLVSAYSFWILPLRTSGMCYWKWKCPAINWKSRYVIATRATVMVTIGFWFYFVVAVYILLCSIFFPWQFAVCTEFIGWIHLTIWESVSIQWHPREILEGFYMPRAYGCLNRRRLYVIPSLS